MSRVALGRVKQADGQECGVRGRGSAVVDSSRRIQETGRAAGSLPALYIGLPSCPARPLHSLLLSSVSLLTPDLPPHFWPLT